MLNNLIILYFKKLQFKYQKYIKTIIYKKINANTLKLVSMKH